MKLALGTVQFGLDYGVSNSLGKPAQQEVRAIIDHALGKGVDLFDTAPAYGDSERVLGSCLPASYGRIVTKTPHVSSETITQSDLDKVRQAFEQSLVDLKRERVYGLMIHNPRDLTKPGIDKLLDLLADLRAQGVIEKIGASLYLPEQLDHVLDALPVDLVQAPLSLLDQRLLKGGQLARCAQLGVEVHARSLFLQGFLLSDPDQLPPWLSAYRDVYDAFINFCREQGLPPLQAALGFVAAQGPVQQMICGVASLSQFKELTEAMENLQARNIPSIDFSSLACNDELLISPNRWNELRENL